MPLQFTHIDRAFVGWLHSAADNSDVVKRAVMLPWGIPVIFVGFDFAFLALTFHYFEPSSFSGWIVLGVTQMLIRLGLAILTLVFGCKCYQVAFQNLGVRPSSFYADLVWSLKLSFIGALIISLTALIGLNAALQFEVRLPLPAQGWMQLLGGTWSGSKFVLLASVGIGGNLLVAITEELIYRTLFLPPLTTALGLPSAIAITSVAFGFAHVIPLGQMAIPIPEIIGGVVMAAGFSIRWSVVPAIVIHAMGNLVAGALLFGYVRLAKASPDSFLNLGGG